ncbi:restriction endonuclease subunit S [Aeromonas hydrophila]|uniref:restriction endonuclease subunit S n=1 Tax=Aeromonas hydrophila TaxID=644 RepID=UPI00191EE783|nr:restriction endonuclease subunit S [Aeromonas hydrophila]MBL0669880.1 restriction endonuclease subunit S [Aeromonas hydrophila]
MAIQCIPVEWMVINAADSFDTISTANKKIKSSEYKETGQYPVIDQGQKYISGYIDDDSNLIMVNNPLVVFGDHTKAMKLVDFNFVPGADGTKILNPKGFVEPTFFYYQLKNLNIPDKGYSRHFKFFKELDFALPPMTEQKEISDRLDTLLVQVEATQARLARIPDIIKQFRQSVLAAAVSGKLTEEWRELNNRIEQWKPIELKEAAEIIDPHPSHRTPKAVDGGVPYIGIGDLRLDGSIDFENARKVSFDVLKEHNERYTLKAGDFIFGKIGTLGKATLLPIGIDYTLSANVILIQPIEHIATPEYLQFFLSSPSTLDEIAKQANSTSQAAFGIKKMRTFQCKLPNKEEQNEIVRRVEQLFAYADSIEQQAKAAKERVDNLTQAILAKAFRGELTADWRVANPHLISGDNSAAALLARIQAERAANGGKKKKRTLKQ